MKIGFTGTRQGMTEKQSYAFKEYISLQFAYEFHHGDCVGADDEAANVVHQIAPRCKIFRHPPVDRTHTAGNTHGTDADKQKTHLARNRDIVNAVDELVATPYENDYQVRGGTWYTISFAEKVGKPVVIIWPNGVVQRSE